MNINQKTACKLWREQFGTQKWAEDFAGRPMYFEDYGKPDARREKNGKMHRTGWDLHHILPKAQTGQDTCGNLLCTAIETNREIGDRITFKANGKRYQVQKTYCIVALK